MGKTFTDIAIEALNIVKKLERRGAAHRQACDNAHRAQVAAGDENREELSERMFVRLFGDKVAHVRYSGRADFVGLMVYGRHIGFIVTRDAKLRRRLRIITIDEQNHVRLTPRYIVLTKQDSLSNLQRGLLRWVN